MAHLTGEKSDGSDVIGIYPLLPDDTCRFLVFDFDDHEASPGTAWREDVDALRKICSRNAVPCHVERSRSGSGAHIWLFFDAPISAELARKFGSALLTEGAKSVNLKDFKTYDRMLPAQEHLPDGGLGNLIALPLQGQALRQGNVEQYAGRLHRDYEGKRDVIIYDYVDAHIRVLESMYYKRLRTYKRIGYEIFAAPNEEKQTANAIFDRECYLPVYEKDLQQAHKSIYIASPGLNKNKVRRLIALVEERQTAGAIVTVITQPAESYPQTRAESTKTLQAALTAAGIYVVPQPDLHTHFAVIDQEVVWYGSTNLLSRDNEDDSLMRICSRDVALELLEEISR